MFRVLALALILLSACAASTATPVAATGVRKAEATVQTGTDGLTVEQRNIQRRLEIDNDPGSIKHLYVISAMSGDVILYSTVKGKVTSGGKRLTPTTVVGTDGQYVNRESRGFAVPIGSHTKYTTEVLQDDGTYGHSAEYLFWFDVRDVYHQHYVSGGQIVHISAQPMNWPKILLNLEAP